MARLSGSIGFVWLACALASCVSGPRAAVTSALDRGDVPGALAAYDRFRRDEEPDLALLSRIAGHVLVKAALSEDVSLREAALSELTLAGTAGAPRLWDVVHASHAATVRARALETLAMHGDDDARDALRDLLRSTDPDVLASALSVADEPADQGMLLAAIQHASPRVRGAAARSLAAAGRGSARVVRVLSDAVRVDPEPLVRAAAARSLGVLGGPVAMAALRERLDEPAESVQLAVIGALGRLDVELARATLAPLLESRASTRSIEAARTLASAEVRAGGQAVGARAFLLRALEAPEPTLRAQAAVALISLGRDAELDDTLVRALTAERDAATRSALAASLLGSRVPAVAAAARETLAASLREASPLGVRAAAVLAALRDPSALRALVAFARSSEAAVRRLAVRALARDALRPELVRGALVNEDALTRIRAAGGILAAAAARRA